MKGKRVRTGRYTAGHLAARRSKGRRRDAEGQTVVKIVICGAIFVLIVALKLLFPETAEDLSRTASRLIGNHADFKEAFAAMGRAASGEKGVEESLQDAYAAVFSPSASNDETDDEEHGEMAEEAATFTEMTVSRDIQTDEETMESEMLSYSSPIPSLPENVDSQLHEFGFDCVIPVRGTMTSPFGWRIHPIAGDLRFHYGIDLAADVGTEICSFADGEVFATGESSTLGKYIIISHGGGYRTLYAHCSSVLKLSGKVAAGDIIATVGESGSATGPHLHFELMNGQLYLDPACYVELG